MTTHYFMNKAPFFGTGLYNQLLIKIKYSYKEMKVLFLQLGYAMQILKVVKNLIQK